MRATAAADAAGASAPGVVRARRGGRRRERREGGRARRADGAPRATTDASTLRSRAPLRRGRRRRARLRHRRRRADVALHGADGDLVGGVFAARRRRGRWRGSGPWPSAASVVVAQPEQARAYAAVLAALDDATELWFEPTSTAKAAAAFAEIRHRCDVVTPNEAELAALLRACGGAPVGLRRVAAALAQRGLRAGRDRHALARASVLATRDGQVAALPRARAAGARRRRRRNGAPPPPRAGGTPERRARARAAAGRVVRGGTVTPAVATSRLTLDMGRREPTAEGTVR